MPIERHLVGARRLRDRLDPDGADAMPIKQLTGSRQNAGPRSVLFLRFGDRVDEIHGAPLTRVLPVSIYLMLPISTTRRRQSHADRAARAPPFDQPSLRSEAMTPQQASQLRTPEFDPDAAPHSLQSPYWLGDLELRN